MSETDILYRALENLERLVKFDFKLDYYNHSNGHAWDAALDVQSGAVVGHFEVVVKNNVYPSNLVRVIDQFKNSESLLVAKYISTPGKELLERQGINYLDIAGNCFIKNDKGLFWHVKGQGAPTEVKEVKHKAFNKNGIKLVYALLLENDLLNESYRVMADVAGISISTMGDILNDLRESKLLFQVNKRQLMFANKSDLLSRWITDYHQKLKQKLFRGKYLFTKDYQWQNWKQLDLGSTAFWGGEPAAELLSHFLQPSVWTIYTDLDRRSLIQDLRLVPAKDGNVEIYSPFWKLENRTFVNPELKTVHPLLAYAELIGSGNDRNFEAAQKLYAQHLQSIIE
jgi:hypothetical protein